MKNYDKKHFQEEKSRAFRCGHCHVLVVVNEYIGTKNRNHCNYCLWSKHVDEKTGDRAAVCQSGMQPIGLTMKREGFSRYGELMLIHTCTRCEKISINRIAADDSTDKILQIFTDSQSLDATLRKKLNKQFILLLVEKDSNEVKMQLLGK